MLYKLQCWNSVVRNQSARTWIYQQNSESLFTYVWYWIVNTSKRVVWKNIQQNELKNPSPRGWQLFRDRRALTNQISHWSSIYRNDPKVIFRRSQSSSSINITVYRKGKYAMSQRSCRSPHDLFGLLMISWESLGRTIN